jgi:23S rRNA G2445 N2-methylase RlmL
MNRTQPLIISGRPALGIGNYLIPNPPYITLLCPDCSRLAMASLYRVFMASLYRVFMASLYRVFMASLYRVFMASLYKVFMASLYRVLAICSL